MRVVILFCDIEDGGKGSECASDSSVGAQYECTDLQTRVWLEVLWLYRLILNGNPRTDCRRMVVCDIRLLLSALFFYEHFRADVIAASDLATLTNSICDETTRRLLAEFFCYVTQQW